VINIKRTFDPLLIKGLILADFDNMTEDFCPNIQKWQPDLSHNRFYLVPYANETALGLFVGVKLTETLMEVHVRLRKQARVPGSETYGKLCFEWIKENTNIKKFIALVPADKPKAKAYAERCGFKFITKITKAFSRKGELIDLELLGTEE
jgi:hypothetical protein